MLVAVANPLRASMNTLLEDLIRSRGLAKDEDNPVRKVAKPSRILIECTKPTTIIPPNRPWKKSRSCNKTSVVICVHNQHSESFLRNTKVAKRLYPRCRPYIHAILLNWILVALILLPHSITSIIIETYNPTMQAYPIIPVEALIVQLWTSVGSRGITKGDHRTRTIEEKPNILSMQRRHKWRIA